MSEDFDEKAVFLSALDLGESDRAAFLQGVCPDAATLARITALLNSHKAGFPVRPTAPEPPAHPGSVDLQIGSFRIVREIGRGGMGIVYLAEDIQLDRQVALKVLGPELLRSPQAVAHLQREAKLSAALTHPGVVQVFQFGLADGRGFIASAYVNGPTLKAVIDEERTRRQPGASSRAWIEFCSDTIATVAETLSYCHQQHIIHRDVKPSNILIDPEGGPRLTDFGIAISDGTVRGHTKHERSSDAPASSAHHASEEIPRDTLEGSCHYMSPEQASLKQVRIDARSDVFSLGVVLYEMLALRRPFEGESTDRILRSVRESTEARLGTIDRRIPADLITICHKCLEKDPADRYQSAAHVAADLRSWRAGEPILARPRSLPSRFARWIYGRRRGVAWAALFVMTLVAAWLLVAQQTHKAMGRIVIPEEMRGYRLRVERLDTGTTGTSSAVVVIKDRQAPFTSYLAPGLYRLVFERKGDARRDAISLITPGYIDRVVVRRIHDDDRRSLIAFQGGETDLGAASADSSLNTTRRVMLGRFRISSTEVSNRDFREFVLDTGSEAPQLWPDPYDASMDDLPVVGISWDAANAYCRWRGVCLPTADEWEAVARAPDGRRFPWGNAALASLLRDASREISTYAKLARPVTSDPELRSPLGLYHLASNVTEFVAAIDPALNNGIILKGRSFRDDVELSSLDHITLPGRHLWAPNVGFRVLVQE